LTIENHAGSKTSDALSQLLRDPHQSNRHDIWLWLDLYLNEGAKLNPNTCNRPTMRDEIAKCLKQRANRILSIPSKKDRLLLLDERLGWIEEGNERQHKWLLARIEQLTGIRIPRELVHLEGKDHLVAMIDLWDIELETKAREVNSLREEWLRHVARDSAFEWFSDKKESKKRCTCAWEWLEKHHLRPHSRQLPISNYNELLMFFDHAALGRHEQKAMIQEIKKRWNRQQFDERNADKKQINVMLSKAVIAKLDELAKQHGLKRAQVIETLVRMEAETSAHLAST
jgi:hypothetical protein